MNNVVPRSTVLRQALGKTSVEEQRAVTMLTVPEACKNLRISKHLIYKLINDGSLTSVRIGRRRLISSASVARFISQLEAEGSVA
jgi:excisionase family DNA binding protein